MIKILFLFLYNFDKKISLNTDLHLNNSIKSW